MDVFASVRRQVLRLRTVIPVAIAVAGLLLALRSLLGISPSAVRSELSYANPVLLLLAVGVFYLTFPVRALRWRVLLNNAGQSGLPPLDQLTRMMVLGSFANSVTVAQLGDLYRGYLLRQEAGVSLPMTLGTIVAERLVDLVTLIGLLAAAALTVYRGQLPRSGVDALLRGVIVLSAECSFCWDFRVHDVWWSGSSPAGGALPTTVSSTAQSARCIGSHRLWSTRQLGG